jgi:hypothetical protein
MSKKQVECPECGDMYKVQGLYGHLRMGHNIGGNELEEKYSEAVGESRGAGMRDRDVSKSPTIQQMFGPSDEGYGPHDEGGAMGLLRELAISRRMREIAENLNERYSAVHFFLQETREKMAHLEGTLARKVIEMSDEDPLPDARISDVLKGSSNDRRISELMKSDSAQSESEP